MSVLRDGILSVMLRYSNESVIKASVRAREIKSMNVLLTKKVLLHKITDMHLSSNVAVRTIIEM